MAGRIWLIDVARTLALIGMVAFHLVFDLQLFGFLPPGTSVNGVFYWHARIVAGSFLFVAGLSLWLAHGQGVRWGAFWRRWLRLALAAALVSAATRVTMGEAWVFFGILHSIVLSSLLGLAFLRLPAALTLLLGGAVMAASYVLPGLVQLDAPALRFLGLSLLPTYTVDFEPLFPWFGPFLLGLGLARLAGPLWPRLAALRGPASLGWPGRHSLALYLIHQPVLMALVWAAAALMR